MFRGHLSRFFQERPDVERDVAKVAPNLKKISDTLDNIVGQMFEFHT